MWNKLEKNPRVTREDSKEETSRVDRGEISSRMGAACPKVKRQKTKSERTEIYRDNRQEQVSNVAGILNVAKPYFG